MAVRIGLAGLGVCLVLPVAGTGAAPLVCEPWTAVDGLERPVAQALDCGPPRPGKAVGIFYFLWLGGHEQQGPHDITRILQQPEAERQWGKKGVFHWWGEPRFGYYLSDDEWVIAKHAQLLADAGVDVVIFDVTNSYTYRSHYLTLCRVYRELRAKGWRTPQVSFLFNANARKTTLEVYRDFYQKNLYPELWFRWKGKPLLLTIPEEMPPEIRDFFTIRRSWAWSDSAWFGDGRDKWPWLDHTPQAYGWHEDPSIPEFVPVAAAEHPTSSIGRSHRRGVQPPPDGQDPLIGTYFQEQWDHALQVNPEFIFITGWNEWVAQRFIVDDDRAFADGRIRKGDTWFVDQYSMEYSRDIEPMRGGYEDNYYYQMVSNIRRFKGVRPPTKSSRLWRIAIDGRIEDWNDVVPEYEDARGDILHRRHPGYGEAGPYLNEWGRNDMVTCKVARDADCVYFLVKTADSLTVPATPDPGWMNLLLHVGGTNVPDWGGFQYRIMPTVGGEGTAAICVYRDHRWIQVEEVPCAVGEDFIELAFPLKDDTAPSQPLEVEFKWIDNMPEPLTSLDFIDHGDTAPNGRFRFIYTYHP